MGSILKTAKRRNLQARLLLLFLFCGFNANAQLSQFDKLMSAGKAEFKKEAGQQDYAAVVKTFEAAVRLKPTNAEAHYFLGYAYSRLNKKDGEGLPHTRLALTLKASSEFETVNRLAPRYRGEELVLDPYTKIASEWSSLAVHYMTHNQPDSVRWAFEQGRKRGGFSDFMLASARSMLDQCSPNAIIIAAGDTYTFSMWYVQLHDGYRTDVSVVDIGLLASRWYPAYLEKTASVLFKLPSKARDSLDYLPWKTTLITIDDPRTRRPFSWKVSPTVDSTDLYRTDVLLLALLQANQFQREVYFTHAFPPESQLGLRVNHELMQRLVVHQVNSGNEPELPLAQFLTGMQKILPMVKTANANSSGEMQMVSTLRYGILDRLSQKIASSQKNEFGPLFSLLNQHFPQSKYPLTSPDQKEIYDYARTNK